MLCELHDGNTSGFVIAEDHIPYIPNYKTGLFYFCFYSKVAGGHFMFMNTWKCMKQILFKDFPQKEMWHISKLAHIDTKNFKRSISKLFRGLEGGGMEPRPVTNVGAPPHSECCVNV
jgi:hypothetical protein